MAAWRAHASPCRQPRLGFCTGCGDTALVALPTEGLLCLGPSDSKILTAKEANDRWMDGQRHPGRSKSKNAFKKQEAPSLLGLMVLRLVSACSMCKASLGMKQFQL